MWIKLPSLPTAAQAPALLADRGASHQARCVRRCGACIPPSWWAQRCTSSFLMKYFPFFLSNRVCPGKGRAHGKQVWGWVPSPCMGYPQDSQHTAVRYPPHPAAAVRHLKSSCWVSEQTGFFGTTWQGEKPPTKVPEDLQPKADAGMPKPLRGHLPCGQGAELPLPRVWKWKLKSFQSVILCSISLWRSGRL